MDDLVGVFYVEWFFVEGGWMVYGEGIGDSVVEVVGLVWIGEVLEGVFGV